MWLPAITWTAPAIALGNVGLRTRSQSRRATDGAALPRNRRRGGRLGSLGRVCLVRPHGLERKASSPSPRPSETVMAARVTSFVPVSAPLVQGPLERRCHSAQFSWHGLRPGSRADCTLRVVSWRTGMGSREGYIRFTGWLCVVTGGALLIVSVLAAAQGKAASAAVWFVAAAVLIVWGVWRLRSMRS